MTVSVVPPACSPARPSDRLEVPAVAAIVWVTGWSGSLPARPSALDAEAASERASGWGRGGGAKLGEGGRAGFEALKVASQHPQIFSFQTR